MSHFNQLFIHGYIHQFNNEHTLFMVIAHDINTIITFFCGQLLSVQLFSIGSNCYGQQGIDNEYKTLTIVKTFEKEIKDIISGNCCVYILFNDGTYTCCGNNFNGQLGIGHFSNVKTFYPMKDFQINQIYSAPNGSKTVFCMTLDNKLYAVGNNNCAQFGIKTKEGSNNKWIRINTLLNIKKVSTSEGYTTFLSESGKIYVTGNDYGFGSLGLGKETKKVSLITEIKTKTKFKDIYCGA
eukprot:348784_1